MANKVFVSDTGTIRIVLDENLTLVIFSNKTFEIQTKEDAYSDGDAPVSFAGAIPMPEWLYLAIRFASIMYADKHNMRPLPKYGDHVTLEEFKKWCDKGYITDNDGIGYYATETEISGKPASPSLFQQGDIEEGFTHVCWFNK